MQLLVDNGVEIDEKDKSGATPLHIACLYARLDVVQFLLSNGADFDSKTPAGLTPLDVACVENHPEIVWFLVRQCPKIVL